MRLKGIVFIVFFVFNFQKFFAGGEKVGKFENYFNSIFFSNRQNSQFNFLFQIEEGTSDENMKAFAADLALYINRMFIGALSENFFLITQDVITTWVKTNKLLDTATNYPLWKK